MSIERGQDDAGVGVAATTLRSDLASTEDSKGASLVGVEDDGSKFTATDVEGVLQEVAVEVDTNTAGISTLISDLASTANTKGASLIGVEDAAANFTATDVEGVLTEIIGEVETNTSDLTNLKPSADVANTYLRRNAGNTAYETKTPQNVADEVFPLFTGQLPFPATQDPSADANTLDDYEEGTWTPVLTDGTNDATTSVGVGTYIKIGRVNYITCRLLTSSLGSVTGDVFISGLPFTSSSTANTHSSITAGGAAGLALAAAGRNLSGYIVPSATRISLLLWDSSAGITPLDAAEWSANGDGFFSGFYII